MRVLLFIDNLGSGGAQRQIVLLARELWKLGVDVTIAYYGSNEHMRYMLDGTNVKLKRIVDGDKGNYFLRLLKVLKVLNDIAPSVLISYLDMPNKISALFKLLNPKCTWIASERNLNSAAGYQVLWRKVLYRLTKYVVPNSFAQKDWLVQNKIVQNDKLKVIWNGVANEFFSDKKIHLKSNRFISLGRISYQKNPELLIQALKLIDKKTLTKFIFDWYGDEDPGELGKRSNLNETAKSSNLPLYFYEATPQSINKLLLADCLVLTSRYEGTPNVVLEAMAAGILVIAPNIVDLPVILGRGQRGLLFETGNPESLKNSIEQFIKMTSTEKNLIVKSAKEFAIENFSGKSLAENYINLFCGTGVNND